MFILHRKIEEKERRRGSRESLGCSPENREKKSKGLAKFCYKPSEGEKEKREKLEADGVVLQPKEGKRAQAQDQTKVMVGC